MSTFDLFGRDGSQSTGDLHPEVAEASTACLKRDLRCLRKIANRPFLRRPYADLQEVQMIAASSPTLQVEEVAGIAVFPLVRGDTNARVPLTAAQVSEEIGRGEILDLWTRKGFA